MALTRRDFTVNSGFARTVDIVQPIVRAMRAAGQDDDAIERVLAIYLETRTLPDTAVMDAADAALIRTMIARNAAAIDQAEFISSLPTEWQARGTDE